MQDAQQVSPLLHASSLPWPGTGEITQGCGLPVQKRRAKQKAAAVLKPQPTPSVPSRLSCFFSLQLLNFPFQQPQSQIAHFCLLGVYYYYLCVLQTSRMPLAQETAEQGS